MENLQSSIDLYNATTPFGRLIWRDGLNCLHHGNLKGKCANIGKVCSSSLIKTVNISWIMQTVFSVLNAPGVYFKRGLVDRRLFEAGV